MNNKVKLTIEVEKRWLDRDTRLQGYIVAEVMDKYYKTVIEVGDWCSVEDGITGVIRIVQIENLSVIDCHPAHLKYTKLSKGLARSIRSEVGQ